MLTKESLAAAAGIPLARAETWYPVVNAMAVQYRIVTPQSLAMWIAQCGHESNGFTDLSENLNYSESALLRTWPKHFSPAQAKDYARQPERIANRAYANRMGNGDEASGDGWRNRGRGLIQLTGHTNYSACSAALGVDFVAEPDRLAEPYYAAMSAGWFWDTRKLNVLADAGDVEGVTRRINGGKNGLTDRILRLGRALPVLLEAA